MLKRQWIEFLYIFIKVTWKGDGCGTKCSFAVKFGKKLNFGKFGNFKIKVKYCLVVEHRKI